MAWYPEACKNDSNLWHFGREKDSLIMGRGHRIMLMGLQYLNILYELKHHRLPGRHCPDLGVQNTLTMGKTLVFSSPLCPTSGC